MAEKIQKGHPFVYRYRNDRSFTLDELERSYVYFPSRTDLNDPFDCFPNLMYITQDVLKLQSFAERIISKKYPQISRQQKRKEVRQLLKETNNLKDWLRDSFEESINNFGIGCFTEQPSNFMMWSHYSNYHKGVCIQYNIELDEDMFFGIYPVDYVEDFERKEYSPYDENIKLEHLFYTKSVAWSLEQELRVIKNKSGEYPLNPQALTGLIFGVEAEEKFVTEVLQSCGDQYPNATFYLSKPSTSEFGIDLFSINVEQWFNER